MSEYKCLVCEKKYNSIRSLRSHMNKSKDCNTEQPTNTETVVCSACNKEYSNKYNLERHQEKCIKHQIEKAVEEAVKNALSDQKETNLALRTEVAIYKSKYEELKIQNTILLENLAKQNITMNNTTNNYNTSTNNTMTVKQYVAQLKPITQQDFQDSLHYYNERYIDEGAIGYAKYLLEYPCNNKIVTTDLSRKVVAYRTEKNEFIKDPKCRELIKMAIGDNKDTILEICCKRRKSLNDIKYIDDDPVMNEIYTKKINDITEFIVFLKNDLDDYDYTNVPGKISSQITTSTPQYTNVKTNVAEIEQCDS